MRTTAQITIQRMGRRKRTSTWPLTSAGTGILLVILLVVGVAMVSAAFVGH